jgi:hypothetical protein
MVAANLQQTLKIMKGGPLRQQFQVGRKGDFDELAAHLAALEKNKRTRCLRSVASLRSARQHAAHNESILITRPQDGGCDSRP